MTATNDQLRKLLLQQLGAAEAARLEEAILMEDGVAERLRDEEFDLIDDYAQGRLTSEDRGRVQDSILVTPERLVSLRVARALAAQHRMAKTPRNWRPSRGQTLGTLLAAGFAAVALIPHWGVDSKPGTVPLTDGLAAPAPLATQPAADLQVVLLLADTDRGGSKPVIHLAPDNAAVRLQAEVPGPPQNVSYSLQVVSAAGEQLFAASDLKIHVAGPYRFVEAIVPAAALGPGARTISLWIGSNEQAVPEYRWQIDTHRSAISR